MLVALDADFLLLLLDPDAKPPHDPTTQRPLDRAKERIEYLIANLDNAKTIWGTRRLDRPRRGRK